MAHIAFRAERVAHSTVNDRDSATESEKNLRYSDDGFDYPPTAYPGRELFTFSLFVLIVVGLAVWGGWKLISLV